MNFSIVRYIDWKKDDSLSSKECNPWEPEIMSVNKDILHEDIWSAAVL